MNGQQCNYVKKVFIILFLKVALIGGNANSAGCQNFTEFKIDKKLFSTVWWETKLGHNIMEIAENFKFAVNPGCTFGFFHLNLSEFQFVENSNKIIRQNRQSKFCRISEKMFSNLQIIETDYSSYFVLYGCEFDLTENKYKEAFVRASRSFNRSSNAEPRLPLTIPKTSIDEKMCYHFLWTKEINGYTLSKRSHDSNPLAILLYSILMLHFLYCVIAIALHIVLFK